jgi:hypothetical protein
VFFNLVFFRSVVRLLRNFPSRLRLSSSLVPRRLIPLAHLGLASKRRSMMFAMKERRVGSLERARIRLPKGLERRTTFAVQFRGTLRNSPSISGPSCVTWTPTTAHFPMQAVPHGLIPSCGPREAMDRSLPAELIRRRRVRLLLQPARVAVRRRTVGISVSPRNLRMARPAREEVGSLAPLVRLILGRRWKALPRRSA